MKQRRYPVRQLGPLLVFGAFVVLWWLERRKPLRDTVEPTVARQSRNAAVAALAALTVQLAEQPVVDPLARVVERRGWGLLSRFRGPSWAHTAAALLLLDYTLYLWHVLVHRVPALWRFHVVHHVDRDLDASTAVRFHFGELALSVPWRAMQVVAIGVTPAELKLWQQLLLGSILFHHSNVRIPAAVERVLSRAVMTPRLHGIHHSDDEVIRDANWSSGLTIWDWLHGTLQTGIPQSAITIGVAPYDGPEDVRLSRILAMPFAPQRRAISAASPR